MKKILFFVFASASLLAACTKEFNNEGREAEPRETVTLTFNAVFTKTTLNDDRSVSFAAGEKIVVFANGNKYEFTTTEGGTNAVFSGEVAPADASAATFYALSGSSSCLSGATITDGTIGNVFIPKSSDSVNSGKYSATKAVAVAVTTGSSLEFKQVCALFKFTVPNDVTDLKEVVVFNRAAAAAGSLSGTVSITPNAGAAPTVEVTEAEGNPHQTGASYPGSAVFPAGTYYIPVLPATLTLGMDLKNTFTGSVVKRVIVNAKMTLESGQVYDLGTIRKANRFMCNTFENQNLDGEYTGNTGALSIVANPLPSSTVNSSSYVLIDDMHTGGSTSGYWQTKSEGPFGTKFNSSCRSSFTTVRMKMYWSADHYYPRFLYNKSTSMSSLPARVNGNPITDQQSFDDAYRTDDWNILEWDSTQFSSKTSLSDLSSFQVKMFLNWAGNNTTRDDVDHHHIAYIDDIEFF